MHTLHVISVYVHIVAAMVWIGGMAFLALVVVPLIRSGALGELGPRLIRVAGTRFRSVAYVCLALVLLTGVVNLAMRGVTFELAMQASFWQTGFGHLVALKLLGMSGVIALSAVHDFRIGPEAARLMAEEGDAAHTERLRRQASWIGRANMLLGLGMALLGVLIVRGC
jgi:uncharacterized membrane protein